MYILIFKNILSFLINNWQYTIIAILLVMLSFYRYSNDEKDKEISELKYKIDNIEQIALQCQENRLSLENSLLRVNDSIKELDKQAKQLEASVISATNNIKKIDPAKTATDIISKLPKFDSDKDCTGAMNNMWAGWKIYNEKLK